VSAIGVVERRSTSSRFLVGKTFDSSNYYENLRRYQSKLIQVGVILRTRRYENVYKIVV